MGFIDFLVMYASISCKNPKHNIQNIYQMFFFSILLCRNFRIGQKGYWYFSVIQDFVSMYLGL